MYTVSSASKCRQACFALFGAHQDTVACAEANSTRELIELAQLTTCGSQKPQAARF